MVIIGDSYYVNAFVWEVVTIYQSRMTNLCGPLVPQIRSCLGHVICDHHLSKSTVYPYRLDTDCPYLRQMVQIAPGLLGRVQGPLGFPDSRDSANHCRNNWCLYVLSLAFGRSETYRQLQWHLRSYELQPGYDQSRLPNLERNLGELQCIIDFKVPQKEMVLVTHDYQIKTAGTALSVLLPNIKHMKVNADTLFFGHNLKGSKLKWSLLHPCIYIYMYNIHTYINIYMYIYIYIYT